MNDETILAICRLNKAEKKKEIRIKRTIGRVEIEFSWRSSSNLWGRFGGGWNWKLGFQIGGSAIILSLLICEIRFSLTPERKD